MCSPSQTFLASVPGWVGQMMNTVVSPGAKGAHTACNDPGKISPATKLDTRLPG